MGVEYDDNDNDDHDDDDGESNSDRNDAEASFSVTVNSIDEEYFSTTDMSGTTTTADRSGQSSSNYLHFLMGKRPLAPAAVDNNNNNNNDNGGGDAPDTDYFQGGLLYIDVNPQRPLVPGWMSHLVNDGATVLVNTEQGVLDYYAASRAAKNCVHVPFGP